MSRPPQPSRRRVILINPQFQGRVALLFVAVILAGSGLLAGLIYRDAREALWDASVRGHFREELTPYAIVAEILVRHLAALIAAVLAASFILFFLLMRRIGSGISRLVEVLRISAEGDLSTPARAPGPREIAAFGEELDAVRTRTLERAAGIRDAALSLRDGPPSADSFRAGWEDLKGKIGRFAP